MKLTINSLCYTLALVLICLTTPSQAKRVNISENIPYVDVIHQGKPVRIERISDPKNRLKNSFTKTSRKCPPFCIHPITAAPGIVTVGELEVLDFLQTKVKQGRGLLIDARIPSWYQKGTIPGAVNIPFTICTASEDDPNLINLLKTVGGKRDTRGNWDFRDAKQMLLFCNGPWCDQSPRAIQGLMQHGYPAGKLFYYRGGMQLWQLMGLTTILPQG